MQDRQLKVAVTVRAESMQVMAQVAAVAVPPVELQSPDQAAVELTAVAVNVTPLQGAISALPLVADGKV